MIDKLRPMTAYDWGYAAARLTIQQESLGTRMYTLSDTYRNDYDPEYVRGQRAAYRDAADSRS